MLSRYRLALLAALVGQTPLWGTLTTSTWVGPGNLWITHSNWDIGTVPNSAGAVAHFLSANPTSVSLGSNTFTLTSLFFDTTAANYTLAATGFGTGLTFVNTPDNITAPTINIAGGNQTFSNMSLTFTNSTSLTIAQDSVLNLSGVFSSSAASQVFSLSGSGTLNMSTTQLSAATVNVNGLTINNGSLNGFTTIGTMNITGGTLNNTGGFVTNVGTLSISGGVVNNTNGGGITAISTLIEILGGSITNNTGGVISNTPTLSMSGGTIDNQSGGIIASMVNLNMAGGTITNESGGIISLITNVNLAGGTLSNASGGTISSIANLNLSGGLLNNSGSISSAIGNFTVTGGTYEVGVVNATNFGFLQATNLTLSSTIEINPLPGFFVDPTSILTILTGTASRTGTFTSVVAPSSLQPVVSYAGNNVLLAFGPPTMVSYIGGMAETVFASVDHINRDILRRNPRCIDSNPCGGNVYLAGLGVQGAASETEDQVHFDYFSTGGALGADCVYSEGSVGGLAGYQKIYGDADPPSGTIDENWGKFFISDAHGSAYACYNPCYCPRLLVSGIVGGSYEWVNIRREITPGLDVTGKPTGWEWDCLLAVDFSTQWRRRYTFSPFATLQYVQWGVDNYEETGSAYFDLAIGSQRVKSLRSVLGGTFGFSTPFYPYGLGRAFIDIGWQREYLDQDRQISFIPVNIAATESTLGIVGGSRNTFLFGATVSAVTCSCISVEASYEYEKSSLFWDQSLYLGINAHFLNFPKSCNCNFWGVFIAPKSPPKVAKIF